MKTKVAAIQMKSEVYKVDFNLERAGAHLEEVASMGAKLAVLPEVFNTGYKFTDETFAVAEPVGGKSTQWMEGMAKSLGIIIAGGIIERERDEFYNTMLLTSPDGLLGTYRKINVYSEENAYWRKGKRGVAINTEIGRIGLGICADMLFRPMWKQYFYDDVDLVAICSAWPDMTTGNFPIKAPVVKRAQSWTISLPEKISKALGVPVIYANACGELSNTIAGGYTLRCPCAGNSNIADGDTVASNKSTSEEEVICAEVEINKGSKNCGDETMFSGWLPNATLLDRMSLYMAQDLYGGGLQRFVYSSKRKRHTR